MALEKRVSQQLRLRQEAERRASALQNLRDELLTDLDSCKGRNLAFSFFSSALIICASCLESLEYPTLNASTDPGSAPKRKQYRADLYSVTTPIGVLVLTHKRPQYLHKTLSHIFEYIPPENYVLVISQDGDHNDTISKINEWRSRSRKDLAKDILHIQRLDRPTPPTEDLRVNKQTESYFHISMHYKFALSYMFDTLQLSSVIIIEDGPITLDRNVSFSFPVCRYRDFNGFL